MKNKRGELTTQQLVVMIILITSFAILLFLLFRLNLTETTQKELCYNSVIMKGGSILPGEAIPLNCKRSYVCLTADGTCEKMTKPQLQKVKTKNETYKVLADELASCWWMFGEGKINYVGEDAISKLYCSFCAQVAFDDSISEIFKNKEIDKKEFYIYLTQEKIQKKDITYSQYLYQANDVNKIFDGNFGKIDLDRSHYVMMGINSDISTLGWVWRIGAGTAIVAGGIALAPFTGGGSAGIATSTLYALGGGIAGATAGGLLIAPVVKGASGDDYVRPSIIEIGSKEYNSLNCDSIETLS